MSHIEARKSQSVCKRKYLNNKVNGEIPKIRRELEKDEDLCMNDINGTHASR
jgi:hypothetical protein